MAQTGCYKCNGRGGFRGPYGWKTCSCKRPTRAAILAQRSMYAPAGYVQLTLADRLNSRKVDQMANMNPATVRKDHPDTWVPIKDRETFVGTIDDIAAAWSDARNNGQGGFYPLLTITGDATDYPAGSTLKWHVFRAIPYNEIKRQRPRIGERIEITYLGTSGKAKSGQNPAELYKVRCPDRKDQDVRAYAEMFGADESPVAADVPGDMDPIPY
jgi:hypothetical protein